MHQTAVARNVDQLDSFPEAPGSRISLETVHVSAHGIPRVTTDVHVLRCEKKTIHIKSSHRSDKFHFDLILHLPGFGFFRVDLAEGFDDLINAVGAPCDLPLHMI
jgi:hypothetical protein